MISEFQLTSGNVVLSYASTPPGAMPLVMLHGVVRRWQTFLPLIPQLAIRWRVHALDFRGHGRSGRADSYRAIDYADDAIALIESIGSVPAAIYGHSLGAMTAAAVAARRPELVRAIVLEDPPFETMGSRISRTPFHSFFSAIQPLAGSNQPVSVIARMLGEARCVSPADGKMTALADMRDQASLRFTASALARLDPAVLAPIVAGEWLAGYAWREILRGVRCPVLLLQADPKAGGMLTNEDAAEAAALIPDCTLLRFAGAGHVIHWARTAELAQHALTWLESVD